MTVKELADSLKRDVNNVLDALQHLRSGENYMDTSNLESVNLIHNVAKILGAKVKYVLQPNKQVIKEPKYKNIVKR